MKSRVSRIALLILVLLSVCAAFAAVACAGPPASSQPKGPASQPARPVRDDAPALQKLLNRSDAVVTLTPRAYSTATPIVLTGVHDLVVFGYGAKLTADAGQTTASMAGDTLRLVDCSNVRIEGLAFDGNRTARGGFANDPQTVHLLRCSGVTITGCRFTGAVCDSVFAWGGYNPATADLACRDVDVVGNHFADAGRNCVSLVGAAWCNVTGNSFDGPGGDPGAAVDVEANPGDPDGINHHVTIAQNRVRGTKSAFLVIKTANPRGVVISGNQIDGCTKDSVFVEGTNCIVTGNNVTPAAGTISVPRPGTAQVTGNNATVWVEK